MLMADDLIRYTLATEDLIFLGRAWKAAFAKAKELLLDLIIPSAMKADRPIYRIRS